MEYQEDFDLSISTKIFEVSWGNVEENLEKSLNFHVCNEEMRFFHVEVVGCIVVNEKLLAKYYTIRYFSMRKSLATESLNISQNSFRKCLNWKFLFVEFLVSSLRPIQTNQSLNRSRENFEI